MYPLGARWIYLCIVAFLLSILILLFLRIQLLDFFLLIRFLTACFESLICLLHHLDLDSFFIALYPCFLSPLLVICFLPLAFKLFSVVNGNHSHSELISHLILSSKPFCNSKTLKVFFSFQAVDYIVATFDLTEHFKNFKTKTWQTFDEYSSSFS